MIAEVVFPIFLVPLSSLKTEVNKDIEKLVPVNLSKLSDLVKNDVAKKTAYDKLIAKVNSIDTSGFVSKTIMIQIKRNFKNKFLILVVLLKTQVTMLKSLK